MRVTGRGKTTEICCTKKEGEMDIEYCQQWVDEDEDGIILCMNEATHKCPRCGEWYCSAHFNERMGLCVDCSEVVAR